MGAMSGSFHSSGSHRYLSITAERKLRKAMDGGLISAHSIRTVTLLGRLTQRNRSTIAMRQTARKAMRYN